MLLAIALLYILAGVLSVWGASLSLRAVGLRIGSMRHRWPMRVFLKKRGAAAETAGLGMSLARWWITLLGGLALQAPAMWAFLTGLRVQGTYTAYRGVRIGDAPWMAGAFLCLMFAVGAVYLALQWDPSRGRKRCPTCWYDMESIEGLRCPECGTEPGSRRGLLRTRRNPAFLWLAGLLLIASYCVMKAPLMLREGPLAAVPTTVMVLGFDILPREWVMGRAAPGFTRAQAASLAGRFENEKVAGWQKRLLRWRVGRTLLHSKETDGILRATVLTGYVGLMNYEDEKALHAQIRAAFLNAKAAYDASLPAVPADVAHCATTTMNMLRGPGFRALAQELLPQIEQYAFDADPIVSWQGMWVLSEQDLLTDETREKMRKIAENPATPRRNRRGIIWALAQGENNQDLLLKMIHDSEKLPPRVRADYVGFVRWSSPLREHVDVMLRWLRESEDMVAIAAAERISFNGLLQEHADEMIHQAARRPGIRLRLMQLVRQNFNGCPESWGGVLAGMLWDRRAEVQLAVLEILQHHESPDQELLDQIDAISTDPASEERVRSTAERIAATLRAKHLQSSESARPAETATQINLDLGS